MLDTHALKQLCPSVFSYDASHKTSPKYRQVPTIDIINTLRDASLEPVYASQTKSRGSSGVHSKHVIRMRPTLETGLLREEVPEVVIVNSHDGSSSYQISLGIFRIVCSNGLIVASSMFESYRVRHTGNNLLTEVRDASLRIIDRAPEVFAGIDRFKNTPLTIKQQLEYAEKALALRDSSIKVLPIEALQRRREADNDNNLWNTFNIVQENLLRGGFHGETSTGRFRRVRGITGVSRNVELNKDLWKLTEETFREVA